MQLFKPKKIFIEKSICDLPTTQRIIRNAAGTKVTYIDSREELPQKIPQQSLLLAKQRGPFIRYCPGTPKHICCMYYNLDVAEGCNLNCTYCILQAYLNNSCYTVYCNTEDMFIELERILSQQKSRFYRIGTGELTDSLVFDHLTEMNNELVRYFADKKNAIFEIKSKSVAIDSLLPAQHKRRTIISWSVNAETVIRCEEASTPGLEDRLLAARQMQEAGYWLGFHFDPMIDFEGWEEEYQQTVDKIFAAIQPENILWISLGALRYPTSLEAAIRSKHPHSEIVLGELLPGVDHKLRYFRTIRIEFFRKMYQRIRSHSSDVFVYLCMESDDVWRRAFGWSPGSSAGLKKIFDEVVMAKVSG